MSFGVEHYLSQRQHIVVGKEQVEVFQRLCDEEALHLWVVVPDRTVEDVLRASVPACGDLWRQNTASIVR